MQKNISKKLYKPKKDFPSLLIKRIELDDY